MRRPKETAIWTVRNHLGQYIGAYRAYTAEQAVQRAVSADNATASTFRKSQPASLKASGLAATIEIRSD
jgi:hypothetical protein